MTSGSMSATVDAYDRFVISGSDAAQIEQWAKSTYPDMPDGWRVIVQARGNQVHVLEEQPHDLGPRSKTVVRLKQSADGRWTVHRVFSGGRWLNDPPPVGTLDQILEAIDLSKIPR